jgi:hypothetical protein
MESILDQFTDNTKLETIPEETIEELNEDNLVKKPIKKRKVTVKKVDNIDTEEKREQLSILAVLNTIKTYTGQEMSLGDVKRLPPKDVEKYYNRYQIVMGNQLSGSLVDTLIDTTAELINYAIPIDNKDQLSSDLKNNPIIRQELNNGAGYILLKCGRFVPLLSGLIQVAKHVSLNKDPINKQVDDMDKYINDTVNNVLDNS